MLTKYLYIQIHTVIKIDLKIMRGFNLLFPISGTVVLLNKFILQNPFRILLKFSQTICGVQRSMGQERPTYAGNVRTNIHVGKQFSIIAVNSFPFIKLKRY